MLLVASSTPSGSNMQVWSFVLILDAITKKIIHDKADEIEQRLYSEVISEEWKTRLKPLKTKIKRFFLEMHHI